MKIKITTVLIVAFVCLSVSSCSKDEAMTDLDWSEGTWCLAYEEDNDTGELIDVSDDITWYWVLSNGYFTYYQLRQGNYATFKDGVLTKPKHSYWEKYLEGKYTIEDGKLLVSDIVMYHFEKLSKDKARLNDSDLLCEGIAERVKQIEFE